jgi:hypothetical protein
LCAAALLDAEYDGANDVRCALAALLAVLLICCSPSADAAAPLRTVKREILALYDGRQEGGIDATRIHRFAELPLNHLGYILRYRDVRDGLPEPREMARMAGVLTWFVGPVPDEDGYLAWVSLTAQEGVRFIVLGDVGAIVTARNRRLANRVMSLFGLRHTGVHVSPADGSRVTRRDGTLFEFECRLDPVMPDYPIIESISADVRIGLQLAVPPHIGVQLTSLVTVGEGGGFASFNYEFCHQRAPLHRGKWLINPFEFFRAALGAGTSPIPDPTTASGRRIYFSLAYSDGWSAPLEPERGSAGRQIAAEAVARELIEPFPELAATLDLRDSDIVSGSRDPIRSRALVERLLALPQVTRPGKRPIASRLARLDVIYDSISNLTPLATGSAPRVVLTATSNELAYQTGGGTVSTALFSLRETLNGTELPRRLKAANINFHVRVGREHAALSILRRHLEAARSAALVPVSASLYADIVDGFFTAEIAEAGEATWQITGRGRMQTVRFDSIGRKVVDMKASRGVIGHTRHGDALYVALDEAIEIAVVKLTDVPAVASGIAEIELADSRWRLRNLVRHDSKIAFETEGYGPGEFNWRVPAGMTLSGDSSTRRYFALVGFCFRGRTRSSRIRGAGLRG